LSFLALGEAANMKDFRGIPAAKMLLEETRKLTSTKESEC
jgi:hypothetical protein